MEFNDGEKVCMMLLVSDLVIMDVTEERHTEFKQGKR